MKDVTRTATGDPKQLSQDVMEQLLNNTIVLPQNNDIHREQLQELLA